MNSLLLVAYWLSLVGTYAFALLGVAMIPVFLYAGWLDWRAER